MGLSSELVKPPIVDRLPPSENVIPINRLWMRAGREVDVQGQDAPGREILFGSDSEPSWLVYNGAGVPDLNIGFLGDYPNYTQQLEDYMDILKRQQKPGVLMLPRVYQDGNSLGLQYIGAPSKHMRLSPDEDSVYLQHSRVHRAADLRDLPAVYDILSSTFEVPVDELRRVMGERVLADLRVNIFLVHSDDDKPVGTGMSISHDDGVTGIWNMALLEEYRGQGLGRQLFDSMLGANIENGATTFHLTATPDGEEKLYSRFGFVTDATTYAHVFTP